MIPKIIHYCWFGEKEKPLSVENCIASWKRYCSDYQIIEWNESNFDIAYNSFTKEAYGAKKYAFVSDVARLYALVREGGVYLDTDIELIKPIDEFLQYNGVTCFQSEENVLATGFLMCEKDFPLFQEFLRSYDHLHFINFDGTCNLIPNNIFLTNLCASYGLLRNNLFQQVENLSIFPREYFSAKNPITKAITLTKNTYAIHHYDGSWYSDINELKEKLRKRYKLLPKKVINFLAYVKLRGLRAAVNASKRYFKEKRKENN